MGRVHKDRYYNTIVLCERTSLVSLYLSRLSRGLIIHTRPHHPYLTSCYCFAGLHMDTTGLEDKRYYGKDNDDKICRDCRLLTRG